MKWLNLTAFKTQFERGEAYVRDLQAMMLANQEYWNDN